MDDINDRVNELLAVELEDRLEELGKKWRQVAREGGVSYETVRAARKGEGKTISATTRRALERGLEWDPRYIDDLLVRFRRQVISERDGVEPDLRDDVERDLWQLAMTRELGERGAWLLINAYRGDQMQPSDSGELGNRKTG